MSDTYKDKVKGKLKNYTWKTWDSTAQKMWNSAEGYRFYSKCPKEWNKLFHIRPHRRLEDRILKKVDLNNMGEEVSFANYKKPHHYYW